MKEYGAANWSTRTQMLCLLRHGIVSKLIKIYTQITSCKQVKFLALYKAR